MMSAAMEEVRPPAVPTGGGEDIAASRRRIPALLAGYWAFGQFWGVYVIVITGLRDRHGLSYSENGRLLTILSITAVVVMAFVAPRLAPFPLRAVVPASLVTLAVGSLGLAVSSGTALLVLGFAVVGAGNGLIDVFMNIDAQRVEVVTRRPVLQWLHASYAAGGVTGAAAGGIVDQVGLDFRAAFAFAAVALVVTAMMNVAVGTSEPGATTDGALRFSLSAFLRHRGLWVVALVVLFAFLVEGSMDTWSGQYLQDQLGATAGETALAFAAFSTSLFLGRLFAGRVLFGLGPRTTILIAGVGAAVGGAIVATTDSTLVVGVAFLLMGFSIAAAAPAAFGLVERIAPADQGNAIAAITTVGYSGFVWSPPIFGWLADAFSLRTAMALIVSTTLGIIAAGLLATSARLGAGDDPVSRRG